VRLRQVGATSSAAGAPASNPASDPSTAPAPTVGDHLFAHLAGRKDGYAHQTYGTYDHGLLITIEFIVDPHALPLAQAEPMIASILASARFA